MRGGGRVWRILAAATLAALAAVHDGDARASYTFAPYVDFTGYPVPNLVTLHRDAGVRQISLGFVTASAGNRCAPRWAGVPSLVASGPHAYRRGNVAAFRTAAARPSFRSAGSTGSSSRSRVGARPPFERPTRRRSPPTVPRASTSISKARRSETAQRRLDGTPRSPPPERRPTACSVVPAHVSRGAAGPRRAHTDDRRQRRRPPKRSTSATRRRSRPMRGRAASVSSRCGPSGVIARARTRSRRSVRLVLGRRPNTVRVRRRAHGVAGTQTPREISSKCELRTAPDTPEETRWTIASLAAAACASQH